MANSETEICNKALVAVGSKTILNLTDTGKEAVNCNKIYAIVRDAVLEDHTWGFATKLAVLASDGTSPLFEWSYRSPVPADFIRVYKVKDDIDYERQGNDILSNSSTLYIKYVYRITNVSLFPPLFVDALAQRIASELAIPLANDKKLAIDLLAIYRTKIAMARFTAATQSSGKKVEADAWTNARF